MRRIGYARVSTSEQNTDLQIDALKAAKCHEIHEDHVSGTTWSRTGLDRAMDRVQSGDRLVVWRLDRLGRSIMQILTAISDLENRGAAVVSVTEGLDTSTEAGQLYSAILAMVAHIEHRAIVLRTRAGLQAVKERGKRLGPAPKMTADQAVEARGLMKGGMIAEEVAAIFGVGRATLFRHLRSADVALGKSEAKVCIISSSIRIC